jgi:integrase
MTLSRARDDDGELLDTGYCLALRHKRIDEIDTDDVMGALRPIWSDKPETASRLRGRIEAVLDAAKAAGFRSGDNPAAWRGHLSLLLPKPRKLARGHHAAMPFASVPALMERLRERQGTAALALEFAILTAARSGEVRGATWREVDLEKRLWIVPPGRMKAGREHRVPLSEAALDVLRRAAPFRSTSDGDDALIFPGSRRGAPLSDMSLSAVLRRLDLDCTVHGFRSSFRDWCGDKTNFPREVAEAALAHAVGDKVEAAYRRGDALAKRRELMNAWATFLAGKAVADARDLRDAMRRLIEGDEKSIDADVAKLIIERLGKAATKRRGRGKVHGDDQVQRQA